MEERAGVDVVDVVDGDESDEEAELARLESAYQNHIDAVKVS